MSRTRKILIAIAGVVGALVLGLVIVGVVAHDPRPTGQSGPEADALARDIMASVKTDAWAATGAVAWGFGGRQQHLWDRDRMLARVTWDDHIAWVDLDTKAGIAHTHGASVEGEAGQALVEQAYAHWANDSFWLNPFAKFFDPGTRRSVVQTDAGPALLISYGDVGVTPGDAYLWTRGADGRPTQWEMWVSIIPIGGLSATWDGWTTTETGALISTRHTLFGLLPLELTDVRAAKTLADLEPGPDPFAALAKGR